MQMYVGNFRLSFKKRKTSFKKKKFVIKKEKSVLGMTLRAQSGQSIPWAELRSLL
jgi:hypothetical protein